MHSMQTESVLQTKDQSEPAKNRFSVALLRTQGFFMRTVNDQTGQIPRLV